MATETPPPPDEAPDWDAIDFDVTCVRCGYNLKMLEQPRCPECGLEFEWAQVVTYHQQSSDFLFEHQWRRQPIRSLLLTLTRALRPRAFWSRVSMFDRVRAGPLVFLLLVAVPLLLVTLHASAAALGWLMLLPGRGGVTSLGVLSRWGDAAAVFREIGRMPQVGLSGYGGLPVAMALMLAGTMGLVMLLDETLGRCRIRRVQVLRVFAYVALALVLVQPAVILASVGLVVVLAPRALPPPATPVSWTVFVSVVYILAAIAPLGCYLSMGLRHYLKIPHAWLVGLTAVFVGTLAMVTIVLADRTF